MFSYLFSATLVVSLWSTVLGFPTTLVTFEATTKTVPGNTYTQIGFTSTGPSTTETFASYTVSRPDLTYTDPASTELQLVIPSEFLTLSPEIGPEVINVVANFAPDVTSLPESVLSQLVADFEKNDAAYSATKTAPTILTQALNDLDALASKSSISDALYESIQEDLFAGEPASVISELKGLVSPFPTLSAELMSYLSAAQEYYVPEFFAEGSILSKDLSLTGAVSSYISQYTQNGLAPATATGGAAGATSTSSAGVAPTGGAAVMVNAVAAAAGMVGVALL